MRAIGMNSYPTLVEVILNVPANVLSPLKDQDIATLVYEGARNRRPGEARPDDEIISDHHRFPGISLGELVPVSASGHP